MYRGLQNVITHLIVYQLNQFVFMRMRHDLLLQCVTKKVKALHRHDFLVGVRSNAVRHEW